MSISRRLTAVCLLVAVLLLAGCAPLVGPPAYLVRLTAERGPFACSGALLDATTVLTAAHCAGDGLRVVARSGAVAHVDGGTVWPAEDVAVLMLDAPLVSNVYAHLGAPRANLPAAVYGLCPYYWDDQPRQAQYLGRIDFPLYADQTTPQDLWAVYRTAICGGDSGGVLVQRGDVVGVISGIPVAANVGEEGYTLGGVIYSGPADLIPSLMAQAEEQVQ